MEIIDVLKIVFPDIKISDEELKTLLNTTNRKITLESEEDWGYSIHIFDSKGIVGIEFNNMFPNWGHIRFIYVDENYRNIGIGTSLLKDAEELIHKCSRVLVNLYVNKEDKRVIDWLEKNGYVITDEFEEEIKFEMYKVLKYDKNIDYERKYFPPE